MTDLRKSIKGLLSTHGHNIYLQRLTSETTPDPHPQKIWSDTLEKHTVRHRYPSNSNLPHVMQTQEEGLIHNVDMIYYFLYDVNPREGDRIYEMDERFKQKLSTLLIEYALPMKGFGGRIEYWVIGAIREVPN